jgi:hypothetical protein
MCQNHRGNRTFRRHGLPTAAVTPTAPVFTFRYPDDFTHAEALAIEAALQDANKQLESESVDSFDDWDNAYLHWLLHLASKIAPPDDKASWIFVPTP